MLFTVSLIGSKNLGMTKQNSANLFYMLLMLQTMINIHIYNSLNIKYGTRVKIIIIKTVVFMSILEAL